MDYAFDEFMQFCGKVFGNQQFGIKKLAIKRYGECRDEFKYSQEFVTLVKETMENMSNNEEGLFDHLRNFFRKMKKEGKNRKSYIFDSSENDSDCPIISKAVTSKTSLTSKRTLNDCETDGDAASESKRRKMETITDRSDVSSAEPRSNESGLDTACSENSKHHKRKRKKSNEKHSSKKPDVPDTTVDLKEDINPELKETDETCSDISIDKVKLPNANGQIDTDDRIQISSSLGFDICGKEIDNHEKDTADNTFEESHEQIKHSEETNEASVESDNEMLGDTKDVTEGEENLSQENDQFTSTPVLFDEDEESVENTAQSLKGSQNDDNDNFGLEIETDDSKGLEFENDEVDNEDDDDILVAVPCKISNYDSQEETYIDDDFGDGDVYNSYDNTHSFEESQDFTSSDKDSSFYEQNTDYSSKNNDDKSTESEPASNEHIKHIPVDKIIQNVEQIDNGLNKRDEHRFLNDNSDSDNEIVGIESVDEDVNDLAKYETKPDGEGKPPQRDSLDSVQIISDGEGDKVAAADVMTDKHDKERRNKESNKTVTKVDGHGDYKFEHSVPPPRDPSFVQKREQKVISLSDDEELSAFSVSKASFVSKSSPDKMGKTKVDSTKLNLHKTASVVKVSDSDDSGSEVDKRVKSKKSIHDIESTKQIKSKQHRDSDSDRQVKAKVKAKRNKDLSSSDSDRPIKPKRKKYSDTSSDEEDPEYAKKAKRFREKQKKSYKRCVGKKNKANEDVKVKSKNPSKDSSSTSKPEKSIKPKTYDSGHSEIEPFEKQHKSDKSEKSKKSDHGLSPHKHFEHSPRKLDHSPRKPDHSPRRQNEKSPRRQEHGKKSPRKSPKKSPIIIMTESDSDSDGSRFMAKIKSRDELKKKFRLTGDPKLLAKLDKATDSDFSCYSTDSRPDAKHENIDTQTNNTSKHSNKDGGKKRAQLTTLQYYKSGEKGSDLEFGGKSKAFDSDDSDVGPKKSMDKSSEKKHTDKSDKKSKEEKIKEWSSKEKKEKKDSKEDREEQGAGPSKSREDGKSGSDRDGGERKKGSTKQIRRLEALLESIRDRIEEVRSTELSLDELESEVSNYILEDKLQKKFVKVWKKLCELHKAQEYSGRAVEKHFYYDGTRYPDVNKKIMRFINKKKVFPDYHDIRTLIQAVNKDKRLHLRERDIDNLAREAFVDVGNQLQKRRQKDFADGLVTSGASSAFSIYDDPALFDPELKKKLDSNKKTAKSNMNQIVEKYANLQHQVNDKTDNEDDEEEEEDEDEEEEEEEMDLDKEEEIPEKHRLEICLAKRASPKPEENTEDEELDSKSRHFKAMFGLKKTTPVSSPEKINENNKDDSKDLEEKEVFGNQDETEENEGEKMNKSIANIGKEDNIGSNAQSDADSSISTDLMVAEHGTKVASEVKTEPEPVEITILSDDDNDDIIDKSVCLDKMDDKSKATEVKSEDPIKKTVESESDGLRRDPSITILSDDEDDELESIKKDLPNNGTEKVTNEASELKLEAAEPEKVLRRDPSIMILSDDDDGEDAGDDDVEMVDTNVESNKDKAIVEISIKTIDIESDSIEQIKSIEPKLVEETNREVVEISDDKGNVDNKDKPKKQNETVEIPTVNEKEEETSKGNVMKSSASTNLEKNATEKDNDTSKHKKSIEKCGVSEFAKTLKTSPKTLEIVEALLLSKRKAGKKAKVDKKKVDKKKKDDEDDLVITGETKVDKAKPVMDKLSVKGVPIKAFPMKETSLNKYNLEKISKTDIAPKFKSAKDIVVSSSQAKDFLDKVNTVMEKKGPFAESKAVINKGEGSKTDQKPLKYKWETSICLDINDLKGKKPTKSSFCPSRTSTPKIPPAKHKNKDSVNKQDENEVIVIDGEAEMKGARKTELGGKRSDTVAHAHKRKRSEEDTTEAKAKAQKCSIPNDPKTSSNIHTTDRKEVKRAAENDVNRKLDNSEKHSGNEDQAHSVIRNLFNAASEQNISNNSGENLKRSNITLQGVDDKLKDLIIMSMKEKNKQRNGEDRVTSSTKTEPRKEKYNETESTHDRLSERMVSSSSQGSVIVLSDSE